MVNAKYNFLKHLKEEPHNFAKILTITNKELEPPWFQTSLVTSLSNEMKLKTFFRDFEKTLFKVHAIQNLATKRC